MRSIIRKVGLAILWLGFSVYAFGLAPPDQGDSLELIINLSTGQWAEVNPLIVALFNEMGIWPMIYAAVLLADGRGQKIPAWPFVGASFALGAFALLPYLALRDAQVDVDEPPDRVLKFWQSRWLGVSLAVGAIAFLLYGLLQGSWSEFVVAWHRSRFIHIMSLDFCCLCLVFLTTFGDDLARRQMRGWYWWGLASVPLVGPLIYLCLRSPLSDDTNAASRAA